MRVLFPAGIVLVAFGAFLYFGSWWIAGVDWRPAEAPVRLELGETVSTRFRTDRTGIYWVMLLVPRHMAGERLAVVLGKSWGVGELSEKGDEEPILIPWEIRSGERFVASGTGRGNQGRCSSGANEAEVSLGSFAAERGREYSLSARVERTVEPLLGDGTRLAVEVDRMIFKGAFASAFVLSLCGFAAAVLGLIVLATGLFVFYVRRSRRPYGISSNL